jgi:hypothetical protein
MDQFWEKARGYFFGVDVVKIVKIWCLHGRMNKLDLWQQINEN